MWRSLLSTETRSGLVDPSSSQQTEAVWKGLIFHSFPQSSNWYRCKLLVNYSFWLKPNDVLALSVVQTAAHSARDGADWQANETAVHLMPLLWTNRKIKPTSQNYFSAWGWQGQPWKVLLRFPPGFAGSLLLPSLAWAFWARESKFTLLCTWMLLDI